MKKPNTNLAYALCCDKDRIIPDLVDINRSNEIENNTILRIKAILPNDIESHIYESYGINVDDIIINRLIHEYLKALNEKILNEIEKHSININVFSFYDKTISFIYKLFNKKYVRYIKRDKLKYEILKQFSNLESNVCLIIHPIILYKYNEIFTTANNTYRFINHSVYVNEHVPENFLYLIKYKNGNRNNMNLYLSDININTDTQENVIESYVNYRLDVMDDKFSVKINTAIC